RPPRSPPPRIRLVEVAERAGHGGDPVGRRWSGVVVEGAGVDVTVPRRGFDRRGGGCRGRGRCGGGGGGGRHLPAGCLRGHPRVRRGGLDGGGGWCGGRGRGGGGGGGGRHLPAGCLRGHRRGRQADGRRRCRGRCSDVADCHEPVRGELDVAGVGHADPHVGEG